MEVLLISTYELGHQPFGLASPAAWLAAAGASVTCLDLAVRPFDAAAAARAGLAAIYLPMHMATRLAADVIAQVRAANPRARIACYGLYAPLNEPLLRELGADAILGGEFEAGLVALYKRVAKADKAPNTKDETEGTPATSASVLRPSSKTQPEPRVSLARQAFLTPDRSGLPGLDEYAFVELGDGAHRTAGYTEASRGCKHLCRHCPIVPVYGGRFRVVAREV